MEKLPAYEPSHHSFSIRKIKTKKKKVKKLAPINNISQISQEPTIVIESPGTQNLYEQPFQATEELKNDVFESNISHFLQPK